MTCFTHPHTRPAPATCTDRKCSKSRIGPPPRHHASGPTRHAGVAGLAAGGRGVRGRSTDRHALRPGSTPPCSSPFHTPLPPALMRGCLGSTPAPRWGRAVARPFGICCGPRPRPTHGPRLRLRPRPSRQITCKSVVHCTVQCTLGADQRPHNSKLAIYKTTHNPPTVRRVQCSTLYSGS